MAPKQWLDEAFRRKPSSTSGQLYLWIALAELVALVAVVAVVVLVVRVVLVMLVVQLALFLAPIARAALAAAAVPVVRAKVRSRVGKPSNTSMGHAQGVFRASPVDAQRPVSISSLPALDVKALLRMPRGVARGASLCKRALARDVGNCGRGLRMHRREPVRHALADAGPQSRRRPAVNSCMMSEATSLVQRGMAA